MLRNVLFFGSDAVSLATLTRLRANQLERNASKRIVDQLHVVCPAPTQRTRGTLPVAAFAREHQLPLYEKPAHVKMNDWLMPVHNCSVGVVVSFGHFLPPRVIDSFDHAINMHPSLLPKYRGAAPIYHTMLAGDTQTGVSVIGLHKRQFDAGNVLLQRHVAIQHNERYKSLRQRLAIEGADATMTVLQDLPQFWNNAKPQMGEPSLAPRLSRDHGLLDFCNESLRQVWQKFCALSETFGVHAYWNDRRVKFVEILSPEQTASVLQTSTIPHNAQLTQSGAFFYDRRSKLLFVKCCDSWLLVSSLLVEGKKIVSAEQFAVGYRLFKAVMQFDDRHQK